MRPRERARQLLGILGALALVAQAWVMLRFEAITRWYWGAISHLFGGFTVLSNRMSQLKAAPFKSPWSWLYLGAFLVLALGAIGWLWIAGVRDAISPRDDEPRSR